MNKRPMENSKPTSNQPNSSEIDPLLTQSEVARMMGKSPQTIGRWIMEGLLAFVRQPNGIPMIRQSVVIAFIGVTPIKANPVTPSMPNGEPASQ